MGSGGSTQTVQQRADPWSGVQPQLLDVVGQAERLNEQGGFQIDPYRGQRVAGFSGPTIMGQNYITAQARGPQSVDAAQGALTGMLEGGDLYRSLGVPSQADTYRDLDGVRAEALGSAIPAAVAQFAGNGMTDSSMARSEVGRAATQAIAPIEYGAWNAQQDRNLSRMGMDDALFNSGQQRQLQAAALAPTLDQAQYLPGQMLGMVGQQRDARSQAVIDANMARYYEGENAPIDALNRYSSLLMGYGGQGGTQTGTQPGASGISRVAGAGLTGLGAYGALSAAGLGGPAGIGLAGLMAIGGLF